MKKRTVLFTLLSGLFAVSVASAAVCPQASQLVYNSSTKQYTAGTWSSGGDLSSQKPVFYAVMISMNNNENYPVCLYNQQGNGQYVTFMVMSNDFKYQHVVPSGKNWTQNNNAVISSAHLKKLNMGGEFYSCSTGAKSCVFKTATNTKR